jgi:hypothetical protein
MGGLSDLDGEADGAGFVVVTFGTAGLGTGGFATTGVTPEAVAFSF